MTARVTHSATDMPGFKAVLFDMDGVILDSEPIHERALQVALRSYKIEIPASASPLFRGLTEKEICRMVVKRWGAGLVDADTLMDAKFAAYAELSQEVELIPGMLELIEFMHRREWPLGLVTSAAKKDQVRAFQRFGLGKYFPMVVTAADIRHPKPNPQPYQFAASRMNARPADCLVIEDSKYGVASAAAAGCTVIGFTSSFGARELTQVGAHRTFKSASEILQYLCGDVKLSPESADSGQP
ncbi:MAG: HAD family phosphatase [Bacteroidota bacterium]|nr:HAD family phosphatase [Bacteroidota bacterium]